MVVRPAWLRKCLSVGSSYQETIAVLRRLRLNTICVDAACPNRAECWGHHEATFLIMGRNCSRHCTFCNVSKSLPEAIADDEPERIAEAVAVLGVSFVVITAVTRDDLDDYGVSCFRRTVEAIRARNTCGIELLLPDMQGDERVLSELAGLDVEVIGHNIEMAASLYARIRPEADYQRSLAVLRFLRQQLSGIVKTSLMVGLGESSDDITSVIEDIAGIGVDVLCIGQYLAPTRNHEPVRRYYSEAEFIDLAAYAKTAGIPVVKASPWMRSSFHASEVFEEAKRRKSS